MNAAAAADHVSRSVTPHLPATNPTSTHAGRKLWDDPQLRESMETTWLYDDTMVTTKGMTKVDCWTIVDYGMRWLKLPARGWNCLYAPRALAEAYGAGFVCTSAGETLEQREELRVHYVAMEAKQLALRSAWDGPPPDVTADARFRTADQRVQEMRRRLLHQHRQHGQESLTGIAAVEQVFHFLDGPADVLSSATACRRWWALACADSVWRAKFRREKLLEKARLFEVALPAVPVRNGQDGAAAAASAAAASAAAALVKDEAAGVGLAFYARIFALKVAQEVNSWIYDQLDELKEMGEHVWDYG